MRKNGCDIRPGFFCGAEEATGKHLGQCCPTTRFADLALLTSSDSHSFRVTSRCASQLTCHDLSRSGHAKHPTARHWQIDRHGHHKNVAEASCGSILEFTRRDFRSLAILAPEFTDVCAQLDQGSEAKLCDLASHVRNMESLVQRMQVKEKLRIVFIGPLKAGKSTLVNMLLSTSLDDYEMLLPVDNKVGNQRPYIGLGSLELYKVFKFEDPRTARV